MALCLTAPVTPAQEPSPPSRRRRGRALLGSIAVDTSALRSSRDFRLLVLGNLVTGLGTQATLVALPYQLFVETRSPLLTGLLGAVELIPLTAHVALRGRARGSHGPPKAAPGRPTGTGDHLRGAQRRRLPRTPTAARPLCARRPAGRVRRDPERRPQRDRSERGRAWTSAWSARAQLRPLPAHDGAGTRRSAAC